MGDNNHRDQKAVFSAEEKIVKVCCQCVDAVLKEYNCHLVPWIVVDGTQVAGGIKIMLNKMEEVIQDG